MSLTIACLSQKGGVGKSTLARLIARTYAAGDWRVKIADFNVKQKTSVDWAAIRMSQAVAPEIAAEPFTDVSKALKLPDFDLVVFDGRPESDTQTLRLAQEADLIVIPCGVSTDDLLPQTRFAVELKMRGIEPNKMVFVLNKTTPSPAGVKEAKHFIAAAGFQTVDAALPMQQAFINAHNVGRCVAETEYLTLNQKAEQLAQEIVERATTLTKAAA
jgi:chromosome partitioning protein